MADVIVIGGGLSGLAAAYALEQHGVDYTLIEVKPQLGGSIMSENRDGFVIDRGPFILEKSGDWPWLAELGLQDALFSVDQLATGSELVAFKQGTRVLVEALADRLKTGRIMTRMSVSTLGEIDDQYAVCLENGMVIHAAALIVAAPARYAERMFYTFVPEISQHLLEFHYDSITRVSLGYHKDDLALPIMPPPDAAFAFCRWTDSEHRVPPEHLLLQVGLRFLPKKTAPELIVTELQKDMGWPPSQVLAQVDHWPESHCLNIHDPHHDETIAAVEKLLPPGVLLTGSDYRGFRLEDRVQQGLDAAEKIAQWLRR